MQRLSRGLRHVPEQQISPESSPKRLQAHLRAFLERRHPSSRFSPRDTRFWGVITFQEKLRTPRGRTPFSSTPPGSQHNPSRSLGRPPRRRQFLTGQKCPGASRDSRLWAPRPAPAARAALHAGSVAAGSDGKRRRRAAPAGEGVDLLGTHRQLGRRSREARTARGRHNMAETAAAPSSFQQPPPRRSGNKQAAAAAVAAAAAPHPPPSRFLPHPPPPPLPWQRGAKEISPAPPTRPRLPRPLGKGAGPAPSRPLPPPTKGPGPGLGGCPERPVRKEAGAGGGNAVSGRAGLAWKVGR